ncbi:C2H2-type zinc finger protein [Aspergillus mulundensis]|uniref:C2H2-type domain-containing protein n=1 Tax=Aspergillus mulundensis TaxID=1810919 RepID=A0A3D8RR10_9EURO|nr:hypothetical protein DSM5745_06380 [Aspergillus mulundensis]RDW76388.1 hypothetical protein DSM5745_06380 [Aspergillus mulundensis]
MADSPGSPLSSVASDDMSDRDESKQGVSTPSSNMPPSKRRRTGMASWDRNTPVSTTFQDELPPPASPSSSISSDTSGEIPNSPTTLSLIGANQDEDYSGLCSDQVTVCRWDGCDFKDFGNMDDLVQHIHNEHVGSRQKKYSCEWSDCTRKGQTHASGYALRAHMRSHTREKPFYCALPECDRSFTRSDALAKHMRTVHETEALRPSDPVPKRHDNFSSGGTPVGTPGTKLQRIKLKLSHPPRDDSEQYSESINDETAANEELDEFEVPEFGPDSGFDDHELELNPHQLYRLLRRQIHWAEQEGTDLKSDWEKIQPKRKQAWEEKEAIFDDVMTAEVRLLTILRDSDSHAAQGHVVPVNGMPANVQQPIATAGYGP